MYQRMKRLTLLVLSLCLLVCTAAQAEWSEVFGDDFGEKLQLNTLRDRIVTCYAADGSTIYGMTATGVVYTYDSSTEQYAVFAQLPAQPEIDFEKAPGADLKQAMGEAVYYLLFDDQHVLYGFNPTTGLLGTIDADGIQWQDTAVDTSIFYSGKGYYPEGTFLQPHLSGDRLEGWIVPDDEGTSSTWVSFSLTEGSCTGVEIAGAFQLCTYGDDTLLALVLTKEKTIELQVYDRSGAYVRTYEGTLPTLPSADGTTVFDLQGVVGAMACDASSNTVYLMEETHLYCSRDGEPFAAMEETVPWMPPINYSKMNLGDSGLVLINGQWLWQ